MTDKILYKVLCDDYEEVRRILFEIEETGEQIEGWHQIQKWVNSLFEENEKLKKENQRLSEQKHIYKQDWKHLCIDKELLDSENEKLKKENNDLIKLINDLGSEEMDRQMEEILNG